MNTSRAYSISAPKTTHWRPASCAECGCEAYLHGWQSIVPGDGIHANYIRRESGRRFVEETGPDGLAVFTFEPGQMCFAASRHVVPLDRPEVFTVRDGGSTPFVHRSGEDWVEDFSEHSDKINTILERG